MESILIGIKRFFQNKNTVTIIAVIASLAILYFAYDYRIKKATEPRSVPYAVSEIGPYTEITADMVQIKKVPGGVINSNVYTSTSSIVGKYVLNNAVIPAGSVFYKDQIVEWEELPNSLAANIGDGNALVSLQVSMESTYGNSIFPGNYIDLYFTVRHKDTGKLIVAKFIESIKVLYVIDGSGNNIFETNKTPVAPSYLVFEVPEDMHLLLRYASNLSGTIFPVPRNAEYSKDPKPTRIVNTTIENYILEQTVDVEAQDGGYIDDYTSSSKIPIINK